MGAIGWKPSSIAAGLVLAMVLYCVYYRWTYRNYLKMMAKIPGPTAWPIIGNLHLLLLNGLDGFLLDTFHRIKKDYPNKPVKLEYGPIMKYIFLTEPDHLRILLNSPDAVHKDDSLTKFLIPALGNGLLVTKDTLKWKRHRKTLISTFTQQIIESFFNVFAKQANILVESLQNQVGKSEPFDVWSYIVLCNMNTFRETAMGTSNSSQAENVRYFHMAESQMRIIISRFHYIWRFPDITFRLTNAFREQLRNLKVARQILDSVINRKRRELQERRRENNKLENEDSGYYGKNPEGKVFLDYLLELTEKDALWTHDDVRDELQLFTVTGYDTTSKTLSFTLMCLAFNPEVQDKAYREQFEIFGDSDRPITADDLSKMTYLDMVIKETLRLYPTIPANTRQLTADLDLGDYILPNGAAIVIWAYGVHTNAEYWPNPTKFDPERFTPEEIAKRHPYAYIPFSGGLRLCIGYRFAMMSMKTTLSTLLRSYRFTTPLKEENLKLEVGISLSIKQGFLLNLQPR